MTRDRFIVADNPPAARVAAAVKRLVAELTTEEVEITDIDRGPDGRIQGVRQRKQRAPRLLPLKADVERAFSAWVPPVGSVAWAVRTLMLVDVLEQLGDRKRAADLRRLIRRAGFIESKA